MALQEELRHIRDRTNGHGTDFDAALAEMLHALRRAAIRRAGEATAHIVHAIDIGPDDPGHPLGIDHHRLKGISAALWAYLEQEGLRPSLHRNAESSAHPVSEEWRITARW